MKAVVTIGFHKFAFSSVAKANLVIEALSRTAQVRSEYRDRGEVYFEEDSECGKVREIGCVLVDDSKFIVKPKAEKPADGKLSESAKLNGRRQLLLAERH